MLDIDPSSRPSLFVLPTYFRYPTFIFIVLTGDQIFGRLDKGGMLTACESSMISASANNQRTQSDTPDRRPDVTSYDCMCDVGSVCGVMVIEATAI